MENFKQYMNRKRGLTLIEISICILLLALLATGMVGIFTQGSKAALRTEERAVACSLARGVMETYSDWGELVTLAGSPPANGTYTISTDTLNGVTYTSTLIISDGPVTPTALKSLEVTVTWGTSSVTVVASKADY